MDFCDKEQIDRQLFQNKYIDFYNKEWIIQNQIDNLYDRQIQYNSKKDKRFKDGQIDN